MQALEFGQRSAAVAEHYLARGLHNTESARQTVLKQIAEAQICGLGGGRFDTATKLRAGHGSHALIINALQSEPTNLSDLTLLAEDPEAVIAGAALAALCLCTEDGSVDGKGERDGNGPSITLALPNDVGLSAEVSASIDAAINSELRWLHVVVGPGLSFARQRVPAGHASGEEHQLAIALGLTEQPPAEKRSVQVSKFATSPLVDAGIVCINLATAHAIARAVYIAEPLTRRMISINGTAQWVKFGTALEDVLPADQAIEDLWINGKHGGNPASADSASTHIHAGIFCIDTAPPTPDAPCINCGACVLACPVGLRPDELFQQLDLGSTPDAHLRPGDCIECGACNAVCPSHLWLAQTFRAAKVDASAAAEKNRLAEKAKTRSDARTRRMAALDAQREAKVRKRTQRGKRAW